LWVSSPTRILLKAAENSIRKQGFQPRPFGAATIAACPPQFTAGRSGFDPEPGETGKNTKKAPALSNGALAVLSVL
jgi:hypothetical protein